MVKKSASRELALAICFAALYAICAAIPISVFIGGSGMITAAIIMLPLMVELLNPATAVLAAFLGTLAMYSLNLAVAPVFGPPAILIPLVGAICGAATKTKVSVLPGLIWITSEMVLYLQFSGGTPAWIVPYLVTIGLCFCYFIDERWQMISRAAITAISEQATMNALCIFQLQLPGELWAFITPFMYFERTVAVAGSVLLALAVRRYVGKRFGR